jgi:hypothetical protein
MVLKSNLAILVILIVEEVWTWNFLAGQITWNDAGQAAGGHSKRAASHNVKKWRTHV